MNQFILLICVLCFVTHAKFAVAGTDNFAQEEPNIIRMTNGLAQRAGGALVLRAANGKNITFLNENMCGENGTKYDYAHCVSFFLTGYFPARHGFLVLMAEYEDFTYKWVNTLDGTVNALPDVPHFSPAGGKFAIIRSSETETYDGFQIWKWEKGKITKEWEQTPSGGFYEFEAWDGENRIILRGSDWFERPSAGALDHIEGSPAQLIREGAGWRLIPTIKQKKE